MQAKQAWYDLPAAKALREYAEGNFKMRATDRKLYQAIQSLESQQDGLCKSVVATHRTMARAAKIDRGTVGASLLRMGAQGLIKYVPGSSDYAERLASKVQRFSLSELKAAKLQEQPAYMLASLLNKRPIVYGLKTVQPAYRIATTNRPYSSDPNVQGEKEKRPLRLAKGCSDNEILIELDFRAAEPSVIAQRLGYALDGYSIVAQAEGWDVAKVKEVLNPIFYTRRRSTITAANVHGIRSPESLAFLAKVDALREQLRRPEGKPVRFTTTATGTRIEAPFGKKMHNGTLLSYFAQGTISDFINRAALDIIEREKVKGWRLLITCHDSVYVKARWDHVEELRSIVLKPTEETELKMRLKMKVWDNQGQRLTQGRGEKVVHS
jgi:hypothetical protein